jgi:hypothetical protein
MWLGVLSWCRSHCSCLPLVAPIPLQNFHVQMTSNTLSRRYELTAHQTADVKKNYGNFLTALHIIQHQEIYNNFIFLFCCCCFKDQFQWPVLSRPKRIKQPMSKNSGNFLTTPRIIQHQKMYNNFRFLFYCFKDPFQWPALSQPKLVVLISPRVPTQIIFYTCRYTKLSYTFWGTVWKS